MNTNNGKPDPEQGLYRKYEVNRIDDKAEKHADCQYFVLDLDHDPHSVAALEAYAESCKDKYPTLAFDLRHTAAATARKLATALAKAYVAEREVLLEARRSSTRRSEELETLMDDLCGIQAGYEMAYGETARDLDSAMAETKQKMRQLFAVSATAPSMAETLEKAITHAIEQRPENISDFCDDLRSYVGFVSPTDGTADTKEKS